MTTFSPEGRTGNFLFMAANCIAYSLRHRLEFTMPQTSRDSFWCPVYLQHLVNPEWDSNRESAVVQERGFSFQELPFEESWRDKNIVFKGFFQSEKYFSDHRDDVLRLFGFPWQLRANVVACHIRRGDYLIHKNKHPEVPKEWYFAQMTKFPGAMFYLFSDDHQWLKDNFGDRNDCIAPSDFIIDPRDQRPEIQDLVLMSQCSAIIGSASTFAVFAGLLNRNPEKRVIIPRTWICEGWQKTTAADWQDICPVGGGWERA